MIVAITNLFVEKVYPNPRQSSLANNLIENYLVALTRSFIHIRKRNGPKIDP